MATREPAPAVGSFDADRAMPIDGIRVGVGGWTFEPWRSNFYPPGLVQRRELEYASRHLSAIEINGTFYRAQKPATYARWAAETPDGFLFSLKAPQYVTQRGALANAGDSARAFVSGGLAELGDRLGPILWQLAATREFDRGDLAPFLEALPRALDGKPLRQVLEVRHDSFRQPAYVALAREHRITTVFTDSPEYPSFADITGDFVYARLMRSRANMETGYPAAELDDWTQRARAWAAGTDPIDLPHVADPLAPDGPRAVFVFFISAAKQRNPAAAMALVDRLRRS